jgi:hypothetical protein
LKKRVKQIDKFFHKHWNDYRAQQILRGRKMLLDITKKYHHLFALAKDTTMIDDTKQSISVFVEEKSKSKSKSRSRNHSERPVLKAAGNKPY